MTFENKQLALERGTYSGITGEGKENIFVQVLLILCTVYFALYEVIQMKEKRLEYLSSFWNYIDLGAVLINTTILLLDFG